MIGRALTFTSQAVVESGDHSAGAFFALRGNDVLGGDKGCRPFPASSILPSLRFGQVPLDDVEHFLQNRPASVATLRWCSGSSRNAVRIDPGFSVRLRRNPQLELRLLCVPYLAHDDHQNLDFLLRLREPGNNCVKFIEYFVPAL